MTVAASWVSSESVAMSSKPMKAKKTRAAPDMTPVMVAPSSSGRSPMCGAPVAITRSNPPICRAASSTDSQIERWTPLITIAVSTTSKARARDPRVELDEVLKILRESERHGSGSDDVGDGHHPAGEEAGEAIECAARPFVLDAGRGIHAGKLAIRQRGEAAEGSREAEGEPDGGAGFASAFADEHVDASADNDADAGDRDLPEAERSPQGHDRAVGRHAARVTAPGAGRGCRMARGFRRARALCRIMWRAPP